MQGKVYQYYKDLPAWAKGVVVVGGIAIVYFTGRSIVKSIKQKKAARNATQTVADAKADLASLTYRGIKPSYSQTQYQTWANSIQSAFEGCDSFQTITWGSDSPVGVVTIWSTSGYKVAQIFNQLKNDVDYLELTISWKVRTYDACGWGTGNITDVDLVSAIADELSDRERSNLNDILQLRGITYRV